MTMTQATSAADFRERLLIGFIAAAFGNQGYEVILGAGEKTHIRGTDEFGVPVPEGGQWRQADIFACKWVDESSVRTAAIECKRQHNARDSINAALGQATDYQLYFHEVYIAAEGEPPSDKTAVLRDLSIGYVDVDAAGETAHFPSASEPLFNPRFNQHLHDIHVKPRAVLALVFYEVFGGVSDTLMRYGNSRGSSIWLAKDLRCNLQWNCWFDPEDRTAVCGINVEYTYDIRVLIHGLREGGLLTDFAKAVRALPPTYKLGVNKDIVPSRRVTDVVVLPTTQARVVDFEAMLGALETVLGERGWRPHLILYGRAWNSAEGLSRSDYFGRMWGLRNHLQPVMDVLARCYDCV
jgi:hypothetical protein